MLRFASPDTTFEFSTAFYSICPDFGCTLRNMCPGVVSMLGVNTTASDDTNCGAETDIGLALLPPVSGGAARRRSSAPQPPRSSDVATTNDSEAVAESAYAGDGGEWEEEGGAGGVSEDEEDYMNTAAGEADDAERRMQVIQID